MNTSVRLKKKKGLLFLLARAHALGKNHGGYPPRNAADLHGMNIIWGKPESAARYARGRYPLTKAHADHIRNELQIAQADWESITEPVGDNSPEVDVGNLVRFLQKLRDNGLDAAISFSPRHAPKLDLAAFCVPVRVITDDEWKSLTGEYRGIAPPETSNAEALVARRAAGVFLNSWLRRGYRRVVIKGEPGEGKTTALWLYIAELCAQHLAPLETRPSMPPAERRIPLFLPLGQVHEPERDGRTLTQMALDHVLSLVTLSHGAAQEVRDWLVREIGNGNYVLLLDALDELPVAHLPWLRRQMMDLPDLPIVLTTRYHADPASVLRAYTLVRIVPLRWWVIEEFVTRYFEDHPHGTHLANQLRRTFRLSPPLAQLAQNPLLLGVMCQLQADDESTNLPRTKSGLLQAALGSFLRRGDARRGHTIVRSERDEAKIGVLARLAWHFQEERALPMPKGDLLQALEAERTHVRPDPPPTGRALLDEFIQDGTLVSRGGDAYTFVLRRFQEYCLARHIASMADGASASTESFQGVIRGRAKAWGRGADWTDFRPLNQSGWTEVWPLVAGCMGTNPVLIEALVLERDSAEDLAFSRLRLLALALGEFLATHRNRRALLSRWLSLADAVAEGVLERVGTEPPITGLPCSWRSCLAQLPPALTVSKVVERVRQLNNAPHLASVYAIALGEIATPTAREHLQALLQDSNEHDALRANAAIGLGLIGDTSARLHLLEGLENILPTNSTVGFGCIIGLSYVADQPSREALAELLDGDGNPEARWQCLRECERLFGPEIESSLVRLLDRSIRERRTGVTVGDIDELILQCAQTLGRIGSPSTAHRLLSLLAPASSAEVKRFICSAIAEIGDDASRQALRELVLFAKGQDELAQHAAVALIGVGDDRLLPQLLKTCSDPRCPTDVREAAAYVCRECGSDLVPQFLADRLLKDPSARVKFSAAVGLGRHGGPLALKALRRALSMAMPADVRFQCALDLAVNGDKQGIRLMLEAIADREKDPRFRLPAIHAMSQMENEEGRTALRKLCEDPTEATSVRSRALDELASIQRQHGWRPLVSGSWERP